MAAVCVSVKCSVTALADMARSPMMSEALLSIVTQRNHGRDIYLAHHQQLANSARAPQFSWHFRPPNALPGSISLDVCSLAKPDLYMYGRLSFAVNKDCASQGCPGHIAVCYTAPAAANPLGCMHACFKHNTSMRTTWHSGAAT